MQPVSASRFGAVRAEASEPALGEAEAGKAGVGVRRADELRLVAPRGFREPGVDRSQVAVLCWNREATAAIGWPRPLGGRRVLDEGALGLQAAAEQRLAVHATESSGPRRPVGHHPDDPAGRGRGSRRCRRRRRPRNTESHSSACSRDPVAGPDRSSAHVLVRSVHGSRHSRDPSRQPKFGGGPSPAPFRTTKLLVIACNTEPRGDHTPANRCTCDGSLTAVLSSQSGRGRAAVPGW